MKEVFKALSDGTRREILRLLQSGDLSAGDIANHFAISKPSKMCIRDRFLSSVLPTRTDKKRAETSSETLSGPTAPLGLSPERLQYIQKSI